MNPLLIERARKLEQLYYKFHVTSRGVRLYYRQYELVNAELFDDEGPKDPKEHLKLAEENFRKAVELAEKHREMVLRGEWKPSTS